MRVATVVPPRRLTGLRALAASLAVHEPGAQLTALLLVEDDVEALPDNVATLRSEAILDRDRLHRAAACASVDDLAGALVPHLVGHLLAQSPEPVIFVTASAVVLAPLGSALTDTAQAEGLALCPRPRVGSGLQADARLLEEGPWSEALFAASGGGTAALAWVAERALAGTRAEPWRSWSNWSRWFGPAAARFGAGVVRNAGLPAELVGMGEVTGSGEAGFAVDSQPIRVLALTRRFDLDAPAGIGEELAEMEVTAEPGTPRWALLEGVRETMRGLRSEAPPAFGHTATGLPLDDTMRSAVRDALAAGDEPPDPFADGEAFLAWLTEPPDLRRDAIRVTRYLATLRDDTPDLVARFPDLRDAGTVGAYLGWVELHHSDVPDVLRSTGRRPGHGAPSDPKELQPGVTLVGDFDGDDVAHAARAALEQAAVALAAVTWSPDGLARRATDADRASVAVHDLNVLCVAPEHLHDFDQDLGVTMRGWRYQIGVWSQAPGVAVGAALTLVDEVWVPTDELAAELRGWTDKPVEVVPLTPDAVAQRLAALRADGRVPVG